MSICHVMEKPCEIFCDKKVNKSTLRSEKYERKRGIWTSLRLYRLMTVWFWNFQLHNLNKEKESEW